MRWMSRCTHQEDARRWRAARASRGLLVAERSEGSRRRLRRSFRRRDPGAPRAAGSSSLRKRASQSVDMARRQMSPKVVRMREGVGLGVWHIGPIGPGVLPGVFAPGFDLPRQSWTGGGATNGASPSRDGLEGRPTCAARAPRCTTVRVPPGRGHPKARPHFGKLGSPPWRPTPSAVWLFSASAPASLPLAVAGAASSAGASPSGPFRRPPRTSPRLAPQVRARPHRPAVAGITVDRPDDPRRFGAPPCVRPVSDPAISGRGPVGRGRQRPRWGRGRRVLRTVRPGAIVLDVSVPDWRRPVRAARAGRAVRGRKTNMGTVVLARKSNRRIFRQRRRKRAKKRSEASMFPAAPVPPRKWFALTHGYEASLLAPFSPGE